MSKEFTQHDIETQIQKAYPIAQDSEATLILPGSEARRISNPPTATASSALTRPVMLPGVKEIGTLFWAIFAVIFSITFAVAGSALFLVSFATYGVIVVVQTIRDVPGKQAPLRGFDEILQVILVPLSLSVAVLVFALIITITQMPF